MRKESCCLLLSWWRVQVHLRKAPYGSFATASGFTSTPASTSLESKVSARTRACVCVFYNSPIKTSVCSGPDRFGDSTADSSEPQMWWSGLVQVPDVYHSCTTCLCEHRRLNCRSSWLCCLQKSTMPRLEQLTVILKSAEAFFLTALLTNLTILHIFLYVLPDMSAIHEPWSAFWVSGSGDVTYICKRCEEQTGAVFSTCCFIFWFQHPLILDKAHFDSISS